MSLGRIHKPFCSAVLKKFPAKGRLQPAALCTILLQTSLQKLLPRRVRGQSSFLFSLGSFPLPIRVSSRKNLFSRLYYSIESALCKCFQQKNSIFLPPKSRKGPAQIVPVPSLLQNLVEFRPAGRNKMKSMLSGGFADRKHTYRLASVEFLSLWDKNYARSRGAALLSKSNRFLTVSGPAQIVPVPACVIQFFCVCSCESL